MKLILDLEDRIVFQSKTYVNLTFEKGPESPVDPPAPKQDRARKAVRPVHRTKPKTGKGRAHRLSPVERTQLKAKIQEGASLTWLQKQFGVTREALKYHAKRLGVRLREEEK